ncbi:MAG TPA: 2,4-dihydroxyhept-2-ene-1,7-dioic acid aldolase [Clostridiales bacterium]|nr:2,4-dihydroxyhept-2-ene-1,7-dioic acid aldolase [Clostridiales bacterium]
MKENKLRYLLNHHLPSVSTRIRSTWPTMIEAAGSTGNFDYLEFTAEYAPFSQIDLENMARAAELSDLSLMIKLDFQNRAYVAQKAMASGFQAVLFADHKTADEVRESIWAIRPDTPQDGGRMGYPGRRWIGYTPSAPQMDYARMVRETVVAIMIEKQEALENIDQICAVPGVDMVQFGPSDFSLSSGWNAGEHAADCKAAERKMIEAALRHGVQPRCEINQPEEARYYIDLGVRHFSIGDEMRAVMNYWRLAGSEMKKIAKALQ